jgi:hypothetical protein
MDVLNFDLTRLTPRLMREACGAVVDLIFKAPQEGARAVRRLHEIAASFGSDCAVDAVMVLSDLAALPWLKDPAAEVRRLFDLGDARQAEQLAGHLADLDCVLLAQVTRLRQAAQAREHGATLRHLDDLREGLAAAGAMPPMLSWRWGHQRAA